MQNQKIKQWLSDKNNCLLIQDILFVFTLAFAFIIFLVGCENAIPIARADEIETISETEAPLPKMTLPKLPELSQTEDLPLNFTDFKTVFGFNSNKNVYAIIGRAKTLGSSLNNFSLFFVNSNSDSSYLSLNIGKSTYGDVYKLQDGKWELLKSYSGGNSIQLEDKITIESYNYGYAYNNCLLYSTAGIVMSEYKSSVGSSSTKTLTPAADVTFSGSGSKPSGPSEIDSSTSIGSFSSDVVKTGSSLFDVAGEAIKFIVKNPICLIGTILFVFFAGAGVTKNFIRGV